MMSSMFTFRHNPLLFLLARLFSTYDACVDRAAQGNTSMDYPWGKSWDASKVPQPDTGHTMRGPDPTDAHPEGASVFSGVKDMVNSSKQSK